MEVIEEDLPFPEEKKKKKVKKIAREIKTEEWFPSHPPLQYPKEFIDWVDSINTGWRNMIKYKPFTLYVKQAKYWLSDNDSIYDYTNAEDQLDYIFQEKERVKDNTLYFANKYGFLKEGDVTGGEVSYEAWKAQQILLFLVDSWYNSLIGKARQIGFTSTMGLAACKRVNFMDSYFTKFITHTKEKGEEIYRDKIRWAFGMIPEWFRENVYNDSHNMLSLMDKSKKGSTEGTNSRIEVVTPKIDAINGGSPNLTLIDEVGLIDIFTQMMNEGRPTLFFFNPETKKMEMRRQLIAWGTGGQMDKAGAVFEAQFKAAMQAWKDRKFEYGIVPLFFDCFAREGMTEKIYNQEKKVYYSISGAEGEKSKVQFHQHYPLSMEDMFLRTAKTILPIAEINKHILRINQIDEQQQPQFGFFEPVYDTSQPTPDLDTPFHVSGAKWIPTSGMSDVRTTACIFQHPEKNWEYRYYQGTDPINSETGHSKMSSTIWDGYANTISATVFWRTKKFKECYLQCLLLGLYYDSDGTEVKELTESNIGDMYVDYQEMKGYSRRQVPNSALPPFMQTPSGKWWGINNRTNTAGHIANKIIELCDAYAENIYMLWFFIQLKTFVEKDLRGAATLRQTRFQAADMRYDFDDVIFSTVFAYLNAQIHARYEPRQTDVDSEHVKLTERRFVQNADTNFKLMLAEVDKKTGKVRRYIKNQV